MTSPDEQERLLEALLAGTPARVIDALVSEGGPAVRAEVDALREDLTAVGLALTPVAPPLELRARIAATLAALPAHPVRRPVLVVMDMQVDHLTPGCALEVPRAREIVPAVQSRLAAARSAGEPVVYLCDHHDPGDPELDVWPAHNTAAPRDDIWPDLAPRTDDVLVTHRSYSGFFESNLEATLRALQVNTLVLTGCITEMQLFATATDALQRGFRVEVPVACQAGSSAAAERQVLATLAMMRPTEPLRAP